MILVNYGIGMSNAVLIQLINEDSRIWWNHFSLRFSFSPNKLVFNLFQSANLNWYNESLIVPNGSYALTASNCIKCTCGPSDRSIKSVQQAPELTQVRANPPRWWNTMPSTVFGAGFWFTESNNCIDSHLLYCRT